VAAGCGTGETISGKTHAISRSLGTAAVLKHAVKLSGTSGRLGQWRR
jgi:hypothetical protein